MVDWTEVLIAVVGIMFTAIIIPLVKAAFGWLKGKTENEAIRAALEEAQEIADQTVLSLQQTIVDGMKAKSADGKLSAEDIEAISDMAYTQFISDISQKTHDVLMDNVTDIDAYVKSLIESRVALMKK